MLAIAICDDMSSMITEIEKIILKIGNDIGEEFHIVKYSTGSALVNDINNGKYFDIFFLDIKLGGLDGIEVGKLIAEKYRYYDYLLYFVSSYAGQFYEDMIDLHAFGFIDKPIVANKFERKFLEGLQSLKDDRTKFYYNKGHSTKVLERRNIIMLESKGHKITISYHKNDAETVYKDEYRGSLKDAIVQLETSDNFIYPIKSYIINLQKVVEFGPRYFIMCTNPNLRVNISQDKLTEIQPVVAWYLQRRKVR